MRHSGPTRYYLGIQTFGGPCLFVDRSSHASCGTLRLQNDGSCSGCVGQMHTQITQRECPTQLSDIIILPARTNLPELVECSSKGVLRIGNGFLAPLDCVSQPLGPVSSQPPGALVMENDLRLAIACLLRRRIHVPSKLGREKHFCQR